MTRISISQDEMYPVYLVGDKRDDEIPDYIGRYDAVLEVDDETLRRWSDIERAYDRMQDEMSALYQANGPEATKGST